MVYLLPRLLWSFLIVVYKVSHGSVFHLPHIGVNPPLTRVYLSLRKVNPQVLLDLARVPVQIRNQVSCLLKLAILIELWWRLVMLLVSDEISYKHLRRAMFGSVLVWSCWNQLLRDSLMFEVILKLGFRRGLKLLNEEVILHEYLLLRGFQLQLLSDGSICHKLTAIRQLR